MVLTQATSLLKNTKRDSDVKVMRQGFCIDYPVKKLSELIVYCYAYEVSLRGRKSECMGDLTAAAKKVAEMLNGFGPSFGAIIMGHVGNGKTTFMKAVQRTFNCLVYRGLLPSDYGLRIVQAKDIHSSEKNENRFKLLCRDDLLGIDDLGAEPKEELVYGRPTTPIVDLLEYRYSRQLVTFVTTNLTPEQIRTKYGERISDRCREMFIPIVFKGNSFR